MLQQLNKFYRLRAVKTLVLLSCLSLIACYHSGPETYSSQPGNLKKLALANWTPITNDSTTYKCHGGQCPLEPIFLNIVKECDSNLRELTPSSVRQLYVGFSDLEIKDLTYEKIAEQAVIKTLATAHQGPGNKITLLSFSGQENGCLKDLVFWQRLTDSENLDITAKNLKILGEEVAANEF